MDYVLIGARLGRNVFERFGDRLPGDRERVAVQNSVDEENFHHLRNAAGGVQVRDYIPARGLQIAENGNARTNRFKIVERKRYVSGTRDGEQMQNRVCRAARSHHHGDRVFECLAREDMARQNLAADGVRQDARGFCGAFQFFVFGCRHRG